MGGARPRQSSASAPAALLSVTARRHRRALPQGPHPTHPGTAPAAAATPPPHPPAHPCNVVTGFSPVFGAGSSGSEKVVDQVSDWKAGGDLTKLALFYSSAIGCLTGVESTYGASAAEKIGVNLNQQTASLELVPEEYFVQAQYKAGQCLEYLYLRTNKGRALAVGIASLPVACHRAHSPRHRHPPHRIVAPVG